MTAIGAWIMSRLATPAALIGIALAVVLVFAGVQTVRLRHTKADLTTARLQLTAWQSAERGAVARAKAQDAFAAQSGAKIAAATQTAVLRVQTVTRTVIQKVPIYVSAQADTHCVVPRGFVSLHDAAAAGTDLSVVPNPAIGVNDAPSGIGLAAVAATVAGNYGACHANAAELTGLQAWVTAQRAIAGR